MSWSPRAGCVSPEGPVPAVEGCARVGGTPDPGGVPERWPGRRMRRQGRSASCRGLSVPVCAREAGRMLDCGWVGSERRRRRWIRPSGRGSGGRADGARPAAAQLGRENRASGNNWDENGLKRDLVRSGCNAKSLIHHFQFSYLIMNETEIVEN